MTTTDAPLAATWDKPGPGSWELDTAHFSPDVSQIAIDIIEATVPDGTRVGFELIGGPLECMEAAFVNGRFYRRLVPLVGASRDLPTPPKFVLWLVTRVHPQFRRRASVAATAMSNRIWLAEYQQWLDEWQPALLRFNRRQSAVDVATLTDDELGEHIAELYDHIIESTKLHFRLHISDLGPIGLLLVRGRSWGLDEAEVMEAMAGSSPATSAPARFLDPLRRIVARHPSTPASYDEVRAIDDEAAALLDGYLAEYGHRLATGYDLQHPTLAELPDVVVASIVHAPVAGGSNGAAAKAFGREAADRLRGRVPASARAEFDQLLDDARKLYDLRDANGPLTYEWPAGLLRRAMVEAGSRLATSARIVDREHVFDLHATELVALLRGEAGPSAEAIAERDRVRLRRLELDAPPWLGPPEEPPPLSVFPGALAELMEVTFAVVGMLDAEAGEPLRGLGIGDGPVRGRARVVVDANDALDRVEPGDIVIAPYTVPTYNTVLAIAGGVVVENGGLLCHTAVIAREFGIPAIVGAARATVDIADGALVEVDPDAGEVRLIG